jgi:hypothetical protein
MSAPPTYVELKYSPFPHQACFHAALGTVRLAAGGVGAGKTESGAVEALQLAIDNPGCDGFIVAPTWGTLKRVTLRKFLQFLPKELIRHHNKGDRYIELHNDSRVYYGSADVPSSLEGSTIAWFWGDEARYWKREAYDILLARLREPKAKRLAGILTSTPALGWLYDEFCTGLKDRTLCRLPTAGNLALPPGYMEHLRTSYSKTLYKQYVLGEFVALEGAVYGDAFDLDLHIKPIGYKHHLPVDIGWDFGFARPHLLFSQRYSDDHAHIFDEYAPSRVGLKKIEKHLRATFAREGWTKGKIYCDPAGLAHEQVSGESSIEYLEEMGWEVVHPNSKRERSISLGVDLVREKLRSIDGHISITLDTNLMSDNKRGLYQAVQMYSYADAKEGKPIIDEPKKDGTTDHACDALRYLTIGYWPQDEGAIRGVWD